VATLAVLCAVALAAVFTVSGIAKLADRESTRQAVAGFGVRASRVGLVASVLAPAELVVALAVVVPATTVVGLILSLLLLGGFTRAIAMAMLAGRVPDCHCFGRIGGADISGRTVARNVSLAAIAVVGLAARGGSWSDLGAGRLAGAIAGGLALAAVIVGAEGLAGRTARRERDHVPAPAFDAGTSLSIHPGELAPAFTLPSLAGEEVTSADLFGSDGRPTLLVFLSPRCGPCAVLRAAATRWVLAYGDRLQVAVIARGDADALRDDYAGHSTMTVLVDAWGAVGTAFGIPGTPAAVLLDGEGRITGPVAGGAPLVRRLLACALLGIEFAPDHDIKRDVEQDVDHEIERDVEHDIEQAGTPADAITGDTVLEPRVTVTSAPADEGVILFEETTGASVTLDGKGAAVWSALDGTSKLGEIIDHLADVSGEPREVVEQDTLDLVRSMGRAGLLEGIAAGPPSGTGEPAAPQPATAGPPAGRRTAEPPLTPDHARG
jgi:hypothetical protein